MKVGLEHDAAKAVIVGGLNQKHILLQHLSVRCLEDTLGPGQWYRTYPSGGAPLR